jgi:hypothetical protein
MFRWLNRKPVLPPFSSANPGQGTWIRVGFSSAQRNWGEEADTLAALAAVLKSRGMKIRRGGTHLEIENGLIVRPQFVRLQPRDDGSVQTTTTVEINHTALCPGGTFEYQHSIGSTLKESLRLGFAGWADSDLPVFMDSLREKLETCTAMLIDSADSAASAPGRRQIIFGPPVHCATREVFDSGQAHNFCPCCLFTNSVEAFREQVHGNEFHGVRLFASRDSDGVAQADCRINGVDWAPGISALLQYVATWPDRGFEYRKQFVAICNLRPDELPPRLQHGRKSTPTSGKSEN